MQYVLTPRSHRPEPWVWWDGAFTNEELDWLQNKAKNAQENARVGGNGAGEIDNQIRRSQISWLSNDSKHKWVFDKLADVVTKLNSQFYHLDLVKHFN
jgi:hypothetical protein